MLRQVELSSSLQFCILWIYGKLLTGRVVILKTPQSSIPHSTTGEHYEPPMGSIQGYIQLSR